MENPLPSPPASTQFPSISNRTGCHEAFAIHSDFLEPANPNPVEETELNRLLGDKQHCLQEKHGGRRLMVRKLGDEVTGINRRGLVVAIPEPIRHAVEEIPFDVLIDGEAVGDTLHAFDLRLVIEAPDDCSRVLIRTIIPGFTIHPTEWIEADRGPNQRPARHRRKTGVLREPGNIEVISCGNSGQP